MDELEEFEFRHRLEKEAKGTSAGVMPKMDPAQGMSTYEKVAAGAGKALTDLGRGAGQLTGTVSRADVDESRKRDAALMDTGAGKAGYIGGGLVPLAALSVVPGANTIAGSAALGAATGALEPVGTGESRLGNVALGGAVGGGAAGALKMAGAGASKLLASSEAKALGRESQNSLRDLTLRSAQAEGYVVPPSAVEGGSVNKLLESIGGKADVKLEASVRNQQVTNKVARREAGLGANDPISADTLAAARDKLAQPYREVASLSPRAEQALVKLKETRNEATTYWQHYNRSADPQSLKEAHRLDALGKSYEKLIDSEAKRLGRADLLPALKDARVALAKNYDVQRAVNVGSGDVDARYLASMLDKGAKLTGGLETTARFAAAYSPYVRELAGAQSPGISKLGPMASVALGAIGAGTSQYATGTPYGAAAGLLPLLAGPARSAALSKFMRANPTYNAGMAQRLGDFATNNPRLQAAIPLSAVGSVLDAQQ